MRNFAQDLILLFEENEETGNLEFYIYRIKKILFQNASITVFNRKGASIDSDGNSLRKLSLSLAVPSFLPELLSYPFEKKMLPNRPKRSASHEWVTGEGV